MKNNRKAMIVVGLLFIAALGITLYPLISNCLAEKYRSEIQTEYYEAVEQMGDAAMDKARVDAMKYNALLRSGIAEETFSDDSLNKATVGYADLLNPNEDGIMCYIEIPKLALELPVAHGTEAETLEHYVGHVIGSSLPVGGEGTHAVLSGHSGMAGQKMFSDLELLEAGDTFLLHTLKDTLAYEVCRVDVVLPDDTELLAIEDGEDYVTLVTCTPFGVNTHRLLIRGERIPYEENTVMEEQELTTAESTAPSWTSRYIRGLAIGVALLAVIAMPVGIHEWRKGRRDA